MKRNKILTDRQTDRQTEVAKLKSCVLSETAVGVC